MTNNLPRQLEGDLPPDLGMMAENFREMQQREQDRKLRTWAFRVLVLLLIGFWGWVLT